MMFSHLRFLFYRLVWMQERGDIEASAACGLLGAANVRAGKISTAPMSTCLQLQLCEQVRALLPV